MGVSFLVGLLIVVLLRKLIAYVISGLNMHFPFMMLHV